MLDDDKTDHCPPDEVRTGDAIARRALVLSAVVAVDEDCDRAKSLAWLEAEGLASELSPWERAFMSARKPTQKQWINASWRCEALFVLLWAIGKVDRLPAPDEPCDLSPFADWLPPVAKMPTAQFLASVHRRSEEDLLEMADHLLNWHWQARDAAIRHREPLPAVDIEIIQERHHAINWVIGYEGLPWDEVGTDT